ncbi:MAG: chromosomal replication initiator protein DnaA [Lachnospirales bacterium]
MNGNEIWDEALQLLSKKLTRVIYDSVISPLQVYSFDNSTLILLTKNPFYKDTINSKYISVLDEALWEVSRKKIKAIIYNESDLEKKEQIKKDEIINNSPYSQYNFDNYIAGSNNKLAYSAALSVAKNPGTAHNPLFLYGGVGLGKTHLMYAILNYIKETNPSKKILYCTSEDFTNELIKAIRESKNEEFREKYRQIDVLLIDDIQFLINKESTQEEFFHTFNALYQTKRQIVISSDQPPNKLNGLQERLTSRFAQGLPADISKPNFETRAAILEKKIQNYGLRTPSEVVSYIAENIDSNIRELEGALNRVISYCELSNNPINLENTIIALNEIIYKAKKQDITAPYIIEVVAQNFNITKEDISGKKRTANIALARQISMYLITKYTDLTLVTIGKAHFGGKDHTTISHGCKKIAQLLENPNENELQATVSAIEETLHSK